MNRRTGLLLALLGMSLCAVTVALLVASEDGRRSTAAHPLSLVAARTPRFIRGYDTSGHFPNVAGAPNLGKTNAALRQAILDDQDGYAKSARVAVKSSRDGGNPWNGIYQTWVSRNLTSASTAVVSTLIPAEELYPGGTEGSGWISATVDVRTGKLVPLRAIVVHPSEALPAIAQAWTAAFIRQAPNCNRECRQWLASIRPGYPATFGNYQHFALLPSGLAIGIHQFGPGPRMVAIVPYQVIRPYLTPLAQKLIAGVTRPLPAS
jgi:hypothetical protein